jgi:hypothetical protein
MPACITLGNYKNCRLIIDNCAPFDIVLPRNEILGVLEFESEQRVPLNEETVASIISNIEQKFPKVMKKHFSHDKIAQKANLNVPYEFKHSVHTPSSHQCKQNGFVQSQELNPQNSFKRQ